MIIAGVMIQESSRTRICQRYSRPQSNLPRRSTLERPPRRFRSGNGLSNALGDAQGRGAIVGGSACLGLLVALFWPNLRHLVEVWSTDANYSHGFLVPLMSLYFAEDACAPSRFRSGTHSRRHRLGHALPDVRAVLGRVANVLVPIGIVGDVSFVLGLAGICSLIFGAAAAKRHAFALFFLLFMIPLPINLYEKIASPLQLWVSRAAAFTLNATGVPVLVEGNLITLPGDVRMFVAEACSGLRQLTGFLALTFAFAYLSRRPFWYRATLVASAVPIALAANVARVTLTGWIMTIDPRFASGTFHTVEGLLMMGFGLALLLLERRGLDRLAQARTPLTI